MSLDFSLYRNGKWDDGETFTTAVFDTNITHNLNDLADAVGIYNALWRPEENNFIYAKDIIPVVDKGLKELKDNPEKYKKYDSPNGWGVYKDFVPWVEELLKACKEHPNSKIETNR